MPIAIGTRLILGYAVTLSILLVAASIGLYSRGMLFEGMEETGEVAREEFAAILPETGKDAALMVAERIRRCVSEQPFPKKETQPGGNLTMSFGVAAFPADAGDIKGLVDKADAALYRAKEGGRNRVEGRHAL